MTVIPEGVSAEDERQIIAVMVRYATGIDTRNWKLFRTCFADNLRAEYGAFGLWSSGDEITAAMDEMHAILGPTLHRMTNFAVAAAPGGATARSYVDVVLDSLEEGGPVHHAAGYYDDEFVKAADGWKIKSRKFTQVKLP